MAISFDGIGLDECIFYQAMDVPGVGFIEGPWDHRATTDEYLGGVDFKGKTALDVGPASGFWSFEMERRGASVTALELGSSNAWDAVPTTTSDEKQTEAAMRANVASIHKSLKFTRAARGSSLKTVYESAYNTPLVVPRTQIALMGNILQHVRDPLLAMQRVAQIVEETLIISETVWDLTDDFLGTAAMWLMPRAELPHVSHSWWQVTPALIVEWGKILGFKAASCQYHHQLFARENRLVRHFTYVGQR